MSKGAARLLRAASEAVGGMPALAVRLRTDEMLLARYMTGDRPLPDPLLLKVLDIILADRDGAGKESRGRP